MPNSTGVVSYTASLTFNGTTYAEVVSIDGPGFKATDVDMSNLASPNHFKEFRAGFQDGGVITFKLTFTKAMYAQLMGLLGQSLLAGTLTFPKLSSETTASSLAFTGHVNGLGTAIPDDDRVTNDVSIKVSGAPVFTSGS